MTEPTLSLAIRHVPSVADRRVLLADLIASLGGAKTIAAQTTSYEVTEDWTRAGAWPTARRAWQAAARSTATHHLVMEDDGIACGDFLATVKRCIAEFPNSPISFFDMSKAITGAIAAGGHWAQRTSLSSAVAIVMPASHALAAPYWADRHVAPTLRHHDVRLSMYFQSLAIPVMYTAPCLVEHAGKESLLGHGVLPGNRQRVASAFIGRDVSGLTIDWTRGAARPYRGWSHSPSEYDEYRIGAEESKT